MHVFLGFDEEEIDDIGRIVLCEIKTLLHAAESGKIELEGALQVSSPTLSSLEVLGTSTSNSNSSP